MNNLGFISFYLIVILLLYTIFLSYYIPLSKINYKLFTNINESSLVNFELNNLIYMLENISSTKVIGSQYIDLKRLYKELCDDIFVEEVIFIKGCEIKIVNCKSKIDSYWEVDVLIDDEKIHVFMSKE